MREGTYERADHARRIAPMGPRRADHGQRPARLGRRTDPGLSLYPFLLTYFPQPIRHDTYHEHSDWRGSAMARNKVQFQKGLSEAGFEAVYGTEEKCRAAVIASRWPNGFECPACGDRGYCEVKTRGLFQCSACRHQASPIAGTIFASTHLPLRLWFRAMY